MKKRISYAKAFLIFKNGKKVVFSANNCSSIVDGAFYYDHTQMNFRQHVIAFTSCRIEFAKMADVETAKVRYYTID